MVKPRLSIKQGGNYNGNGETGKTGVRRGTFTNDSPENQKTVGKPPRKVV